MRLLLINPGNPLVSMAKRSHWRKYRVWKPLGLMTIAGLTPPEWEVTIIDENLGAPDYARLPRPDLVGLTAFTSQAPRAYELAAQFRARGVPVVMGGIHASMCLDEALQHVDTVVKGEAESVWATVLEDAGKKALAPLYEGDLAAFEDDAISLPARHDLLPHGYAFGVIQTTRGCPLNCHFCSVSAFNGRRYRPRPIATVISEFALIPERLVLIVDDNLIGTRKDHLARAKDLFRAMIAAGIGKKWVCQATINIADDEELLTLAEKAGCIGVFIGFESPSDEGLAETGKRYNILKGKDLAGSVRRIHRHGMLVVGSYIMGLDCDLPGIGRRIADAANDCGIDLLNVLFLTPLPGTRLWDQMRGQGRIVAGDFPSDWRYYTLGFPVANYRRLTWTQIGREMEECWRNFYSGGKIARRVWQGLMQHRKPLVMLIASLSYRRNYRGDEQALCSLDLTRGSVWDESRGVPSPTTGPEPHVPVELMLASETSA
jgi:radical SAM superfamily enzyme YgiQ (UPF0313 family)